jgi:glycosyltransferase involved in cell wall biosynthesis
MNQTAPKVSIGLPVYNGEKYLAEALDSVLAQTFQDFEVILSDNASTDSTALICKRYAEKDARIRYSRNSTNIGGGNNENLTVQLSRGEYFCWLGHDDKYAPEFLEKCVEVLDRDPTVVHCYTQIVSIDETGMTKEVIARNHGESTNAHTRFITIACANDFCEESNGVTRATVLKKTRLVLNYTASDRTLLAEISLYGQFYDVDLPLFFKRFHKGNVYIDWRARMAWYDPNMGGRIVFPFWVQFFDYFNRIYRVPLPWTERVLCTLSMIKWVLKHGKNMVKDVLYGMYMGMHSPEWRKRKYESSRNWG